MILSDYLLMGGILTALIWAVRVCIRNHARKKSCAGDCSRCSQGCGK